jgi:hypothetical protein
MSALLNGIMPQLEYLQSLGAYTDGEIERVSSPAPPQLHNFLTFLSLDQIPHQPALLLPLALHLIAHLILGRILLIARLVPALSLLRILPLLQPIAAPPPRLRALARSPSHARQHEQHAHRAPAGPPPRRRLAQSRARCRPVCPGRWVPGAPPAQQARRDPASARPERVHHSLRTCYVIRFIDRRLLLCILSASVKSSLFISHVSICFLLALFVHRARWPMLQFRSSICSYGSCFLSALGSLYPPCIHFCNRCTLSIEHKISGLFFHYQPRPFLACDQNRQIGLFARRQKINRSVQPCTA